MPKGLKYSQGVYTVQYQKDVINGVATESLDDMWAEYKRLYNIARFRIKRLSKSEFNDSKAFKKLLQDMTPPISELNRLRQEQPGKFEEVFPNMMYDIASIVSKKSSSLSGMRDIRKKTIETINSSPTNPFRGLVTAENYQDYLDFINELKAKKEVKLFKYEYIDPENTFGGYLKAKYGYGSEQVKKLGESYLKFVKAKKSQSEKSKTKRVRKNLVKVGSL